jgi:phospho-N-acetylmuramoyl-pentapeptide-transferase
MGGVIIISSVVISALLWGMICDRKLIVFILATLALAGLGFVDDFIKIKYFRQERDGVKRNTKIIVQAIISIIAIYALYKTHGTVTMQIFLPGLKHAFQFAPGSENIAVMTPFSKEAWFTLPLFVMPLCLIFMLLLNFGVLFCASNGVNLTDGKDGLASGCMIFATLAFAVISYLSGHKIFAEYLNIPYVPGAGEVGIYACAIAGACLGFLWHNCEPASLFMGDTGSLSLGGALSLIAIMLGQQMLLFIIGGVFMIELASSFIQEKYYRWSKGKRVFLMAPLHHHYEKKGMPDSKIVIRFWIIAILFALIGLATLKLR